MKHFYIVYLALYDEDEWGINSTDLYADDMDLEQIENTADIIAGQEEAQNVKILNWKEIA